VLLRVLWIILFISLANMAYGQNAFLTLPMNDHGFVGVGWMDGKTPHRGIDYPADLGTPVRAAADGWAIASCEPDGYGTFILIQHDNGFSSIYAHLGDGTAKNTGVLLGADATMPIAPCPTDVFNSDGSRTSARDAIVGVGAVTYGGHPYLRQRVNRGEIIGEVGMTGRTDGPHLHFEIARNSDGSYGSHVNKQVGASDNGKLDPYSIEGQSAAYPPRASCGSWAKSVNYLWTACPPVPWSADPPPSLNQSPTAGFLMTSGGQSGTSGQVEPLRLTVSGTNDTATITFDGLPPHSTDPDGSVVGWLWTINDVPVSAISSDAIISKKLSVGGYNIGLVVTDNQGATSHQAGATLTVSSALPRRDACLHEYDGRQSEPQPPLYILPVEGDPESAVVWRY
jgi:hypothetical protein